MIYVKEEDVPKTKTRKNFIKKFLTGKRIPSYENTEFTIVQCNGKGENVDGLDEEVVNILNEISDFNTEPEINPNSGNEIVLWGFYKSNLDN